MLPTNRKSCGYNINAQDIKYNSKKKLTQSDLDRLCFLLHSKFCREYTQLKLNIKCIVINCIKVFIYFSIRI